MVKVLPSDQPPFTTCGVRSNSLIFPKSMSECCRYAAVDHSEHRTFLDFSVVVSRIKIFHSHFFKCFVLFVMDVWNLFVFITIWMLRISICQDYEDAVESKWSRCSIAWPFKNGRAKIRARGRLTKFVCNSGFELVGKRFATCVRGKWNHPSPVCIARGCYSLPEPTNGRVKESYRGAYLVYDCLPGYSLKGSDSLYCDGYVWNDGVPTCEATTSQSEKTCDFEDPALCGWINDPADDFDWLRHNYETPSSHVGTGPSYDHTFGKGRAGFYMYIEASAPRMDNDIARLFSPVYSKLSGAGCFVFWYHMYGTGMGILRIYVKPESHILGEVTPSWEQSGDYGNEWHRGNLTIPQFHENFQIIIEGHRGATYISDMAIDDVSVVQMDCSDISMQDTSVETASMDSCRGRCRERDAAETCGCSDYCVSNNSCCEDYFKICTSGSESNSTNDSEGNDEVLLPPNQVTTTKDLHGPKTTLSTRSPSSTTMEITSTYSSTSTTLEPMSTARNLPTSTTTTSFMTSLSTPVIAKLTVPTSTKYSTTIPSTSSKSYPTTPLTTTTTFRTLPTTTTVATIPSTTTTTVRSTTATKRPTQSTVHDHPYSTEVPTTVSVACKEQLPTTGNPSTSSKLTTAQSLNELTTETFTAPTESRTSSRSYPFIRLITSRPRYRPSTTKQTVPTTSRPTNRPLSTTENVPQITSLTYITEMTKDGVTLTPKVTTTTTTSPKTSFTPRPITTTKITTSTTMRTTPSSTTEKISTTEKYTPTTTTTIRTSLRNIFQPTTVSLTIQIEDSRKTTTTPRYNLRPRYTTQTTPKPTTRSTQLIPRYHWKATTTVKSTTVGRLSTSDVFTTEQLSTTTMKVFSTNKEKSVPQVSDSSSTPVVGITISVLLVICLAAPVVYYLYRNKRIFQKRLPDDSEIRFLSDNEIVEFSDPSALDRLRFR